ncbi:hypothetical protein [Streptomyces corynorhini]|uniref:Lipoprotein n=1 Tax=Streptomyces corynorhini TaxID=2282652 RepID=A0A370BD32_9ACTN|nr:hypothetical protein [Streptomyces corynorhini]RDG38144.1 hypothetical protein DVH02_10670 [Streptomyces corynorhini]
MAGRKRQSAAARRRRGGRRAVAAVLALLLLPAVGCAAPAKGARTATAGIGQVLDRRAAALADRDERAYLGVLDPASHALRATARTEFENLADAPLGSWEYRLTSVERAGDRATVRADLRYRITGYDSAPVATPRALRLTERDGHWYVTEDEPAPGGSRQLWQQGPVRAVPARHGLVLGVGQDARLLRRIAATADRAVPAVDDAWPERWARRVVLLVPGSLTDMAALLGESADAYRSIAAVTTGESGGSGAAPADRVIVNPEAYARLGDFGQRVVLTHETTHVATRAATSAATPVWLSEGFADLVAYRGTGRGAGQIAPELQRAVRRGEAPRTLPSDADFAFAGDADLLARAYESGWLACEMIADRWGERKLTDFYRAVGAHGHRKGAVATAAHDVLGTTEKALTERWRAYVRQRFG